MTTTALLKVCIGDHYISRKLKFSGPEAFEECVAMAMREMQTEVLTQYSRLEKQTGGGN